MKRITLFAFYFLVINLSFAQTSKTRCLVKLPETDNKTAEESSSLPGLIQSKFEESLGYYLGFQIVSDSRTEAEIKKIQTQSEDNARDQTSGPEPGNILSPDVVLLSQIQKLDDGYLLSASYTGTTKALKLTVVSKKYTLRDALYVDGGAVDEITKKLADRLGIENIELNRKLLSNTNKYTHDEDFAMSKQIEKDFMMQIKKLDDIKLDQSNNLADIERINDEKAKLLEKLNSEKKLQQQIEERKKLEEDDARREIERSIVLKSQRDKIAKEASEKASEVRKLKLEKLGVLGQINVLEAKKKALVEIRNAVEERCVELHSQFEIDTYRGIASILFGEWKTIELKDGKPVDAAKQGRANRVKEFEDNALTTFYKDCDNVKTTTLLQQNELLKEINNDKKKLASTRTVTSLGDELKVSYGSYDSSAYGWNAYLSLYSDGILLFQDKFIVSYETLVEKKPPKLELASMQELEEYENTMDMYNSLLLRGVPLLYFELDYSVSSDEEKPGEYHFNYDKVRAINTLTGKVIQTASLNNKPVRSFYPKWDIRKQNSIVDIEKNKKRAEVYTYDSICNGTANGTGFVSKGIGLKDEAMKNLVVFVEENESVSASDLFYPYHDIHYKNLETIFFLGSKDAKENSITNGYDIKFNKFSALKNIIIDSIDAIDYHTFENCPLLENVFIKSAKTIKMDAFRNCDSLQKVNINNIKEIGYNAFRDCDSLTDVILLSEEPMEIISAAFRSCDKLKRVSIHSVNYIGEGAFAYCSNLSTIEIDSNSLLISQYAFYGCKELRAIVLPEVREIRSNAFENWTSLETISIFSFSDIKFYDNVFNNCQSLQDITFGKKIRTIYFRKNAFSGCDSLQQVRMSKELYDDCKNEKYKPSFWDVKKEKRINERTDNLKSIEDKILFYE